jgi:hypothetical protein
MTEVNLNISGTILHKYMQILVYADDVILGSHENAVKFACNNLEKEAQKWG